MVAYTAFCLFASILVGSSLLVITARNPVHSVLFLILAFFNAAGLFIMLGAEFIGMILVIVYVGAVAVLFLFVVMMLDISFSDLRKGAMQYVPIGLGIGGVLLAELFFVFATWQFSENYLENRRTPMDPPVAGEDGQYPVETITNTEALGAVMYTDYILPFQVAGLILFVAMIGAIVLTHRVRPGVRKQNVADQFSRTRDESMEIQKVTPRTGA